MLPPAPGPSRWRGEEGARWEGPAPALHARRAHSPCTLALARTNSLPSSAPRSFLPGSSSARPLPGLYLRGLFRLGASPSFPSPLPASLAPSLPPPDVHSPPTAPPSLRPCLPTPAPRRARTLAPCAAGRAEEVPRAKGRGPHPATKHPPPLRYLQRLGPERLDPAKDAQGGQAGTERPSRPEDDCCLGKDVSVCVWV